MTHLVLARHSGAAARRLPTLACGDRRQLGALLLGYQVHLLVDDPLRHRVHRLAAIELHDCALEVLVLHLEQLDLTLQVEDHLLFAVHLDDRLVLDVHGSGRLVQS